MNQDNEMNLLILSWGSGVLVCGDGMNGGTWVDVIGLLAAAVIAAAVIFSQTYRGRFK